MNQFIGFPLFILFAIVNAMFIVKVKKPEQIALSASIISSPWSGGVWISPIALDFRISFIFLMIAFFLYMGKPQKVKPKITGTILIPIWGLVVWVSVSAAQAFNPPPAFGSGTFTYILNITYFITIIKAVQKEEDVDFIFKSMFLGLFYCTVLALLQYKIRLFHIGFVDRGLNAFMWWRTRSTFHHPNGYGMYQMLVLPMVFREALVAFSGKNKKKALFYILLFLLSAFTLYTTQNRGSWVGLAVGMAVTIGWDLFRRGGKKTRKYMLRVIIGIVVLVAIGGSKYYTRFYERMFEGRNAISNKADSRKEYDIDAYIQIKEKPIFGTGVSNLKYYSRIIFTHNLYLLMLAETGWPGLFFFLWYMAGFLIQSLKGTKAKNVLVTNVNVGFFASLLGLFVASYPGPDYAITAQVSAQLWIIAGAAISVNVVYSRNMKLQRLRQRQQMQQRVLQEQDTQLGATPSSLQPARG
jgi:O-antigen ligase